MSRLVLCRLVCISLLMLFACTCLCQTPLERVISEGVLESISTLPEETSVDRIAILPLTGDETGEIAERIVTAIVERGFYKVIDRQNLEIILKEANFQMADIIDPDTAVQAGKIAGVDAVMYGKVKRSLSGDDWADLSFHIQMMKVQTGQIFWAHDVDKRIGNTPSSMPAILPYVVAVALVVAIVIVLVWITRRKAKRKVSMKPGVEIVGRDGKRRYEPSIKVKRDEKKLESTSDSPKERQKTTQDGTDTISPATNAAPASHKIPMAPEIEVVKKDGTKQHDTTMKVKKPRSSDDTRATSERKANKGSQAPGDYTGDQEVKSKKVTPDSNVKVIKGDS